MAEKVKTHVSKEKKETVEKLAKLIKEKKTFLIASIKNIPASQFQEILKKLRGRAIVKVPKKSLIFRALDKSDDEKLKKIKEKIQDSTAVLFSDLDSFELAAELVKNKRAVKAKTNQIAENDIEIPAGPTELVPGPALSELSSLGLQVQVENGKLTIRNPKVIVKKGEKISEQATGIMNKLGIKPFVIGFVPIAAFDSKEGRLYTEINIDREGSIEQFKKTFAKSLGFAVEIGYICKDTISFLIRKAASHEKALEKLGEKIEEKKEETPEEESKEESNENQTPEVNSEEGK